MVSAWWALWRGRDGYDGASEHVSGRGYGHLTAVGDGDKLAVVGTNAVSGSGSRGADDVIRGTHKTASWWGQVAQSFHISAGR